VYLRDYSPYLDSSLLYSESQNIIGVNLLGDHSTRCVYVVDYSIPIYPAHWQVYCSISYKASLQF